MHNVYHLRILEHAPNEILNFFASCFQFIRDMILRFFLGLSRCQYSHLFQGHPDRQSQRIDAGWHLLVLKTLPTLIPSRACASILPSSRLVKR